MKKKSKFNYLYIVAVVLISISLLGVFSAFANKNFNNGFHNNIENVESIDFSTMRYLALGDSITFGENPITHTQVENGGYPQLLKETLGFKDVINYGVSGMQTHTMVNRVDNMVYDAQIVSVMGGTNDCYQNVPVGTFEDTGTSTFYGRIKLLAVKLTSKYPNAFVFFMTPYQSKSNPCYNGNTNGNTLKDYADAVIEVCNFYNIPVLDMYNKGQFELEMFNANSDGTHPSAEFFEKYTTPQIAQFIKDNYKK